MTTDKARNRDGAHQLTLDLNNYVPALLIWLTNKLSSEASRSYRAWYGLGITEWRVLAYLGVYENGTAALICKLIGLDKAATSRSIVTLKQRRLIKTRQLKGRNVELTITDAGRKKYQAILALALRREEALLDGLSEKKRRSLISMLHIMLRNLEAVAAVKPDAMKPEAAGPQIRTSAQSRSRHITRKELRR